jgi:hypothetical protein
MSWQLPTEDIVTWYSTMAEWNDTDLVDLNEDEKYILALINGHQNITTTKNIITDPTDCAGERKDEETVSYRREKKSADPHVYINKINFNNYY